ncbi:hypothetical protein [Paraburkholderia sediminicola]|uniref:hypothetical protein n=1 Tax=Paraburkholderia sediminicola TaxID=458836 RepID=UPI0038BB0636
MSDDVRREKILQANMKQISAERTRLYRENLAKCRLLQKNILELEKRAKTDVKAEKALNRVYAMLRSTAPTMESLRIQVEKRLEEFACRKGPNSRQDMRDSRGLPARRPAADRIV